jgi:thymidylate synthase
MTFNVTDGKLNGILNQRSNDMVVANNWNVVQYSILLIMLAQVSNLKVGELVHVISDAHIYDRHIPALKEMFKNEQFEAPKLIVNTEVKNFYDFTVDDFKLVDYKSTPLDTKLEVAI